MARAILARYDAETVAAAFVRLWREGRSAPEVLSTDAAMGSSAPFVDEIHTLRGHRGQIETAAALRVFFR